LILLITIIVVLLDQLSKFYFLNKLFLNQSVPVIQNIFHFTLVHNTGIAFGFLKNSSKLILLITIVGIALIVYSIKNDLLSKNVNMDKRGWVVKSASISFILGGAIGNMIDRIRLGFVIDFLDFRVWPVFNLADSFITIGAVMLLSILFLGPQDSKG